MISIPIYFSNLNEETQKELLRVVKADSPADMNWDMDIIPLATLDFEEE